ncbi:MAG: PilN domain-containing protein [Deltaproteobacteria bacterium]|nr:PilN domain-containing protein [Deltaproteobacteria bacterium]
MTTSETIRKAQSILWRTMTKAARWGRLLKNVLFFSPADDRVASGRCLSLSLEEGGISVSYGARRLSRINVRATRSYPFEKGQYPPPENLGAAALLAMNDLKAAGAQITLVIPKAWVIVKTAELPLAAKDTLCNVVAYELDRLTPLAADRAFYDFRILGEEAGQIEILIAAIGADRLRPYLEALRENGLFVTRVVVGLFAGESALKLSLPRIGAAKESSPAALGGVLETLRPGGEGINLLAKGLHGTPRPPLALTLFLLAVLIGACLFWLVSPLQIEEKRIAALDREIAARGGEVKKVELSKKELEEVTKEVAAIGDFKSSHPMILGILKEMTQVLPGNVWLSRARITESTVEIEGYATAATDVVPKLESSRYFKKVEFSSPTFRDARLNADRFLIKMELEGPVDEKGKK